MTQKRPKKVGWLKLIAGNLVILVAFLLVVGGVGEIYYRFVFDSTDSFGKTRVCRRWFDRHFQMNQSGFRDNVDYAGEIAPGKRRITFLGDSFTAAHGVADVEQRFANILRRTWGENREVHVMAAIGMDTGVEVELFTRLVDSNYELDTVVLVYVLNDISDIVPEWQLILHRNFGDAPKKNWLRDHSYFLDTLYYRVVAARDPDLSDYFGFVRSAYDGPLWEKQKERLSRVAEICKERKGRLLVVTFPFLHALGKGYEYAEVHRKIDAFWKAQGVPHLDLLPLYDAYSPKELVIGNFDAHPNEFAHELAAGAIGAFVDDQMR